LGAGIQVLAMYRVASIHADRVVFDLARLQ
jgi:hypothetical protein